ncbi:type II secretion system secretin GspD [Desulfofustis glycolicus]|uniref:General secretion pathway protein D n=1 Tax=Desulfofustis glycolicus DSM 9705 TaxID=1121409 RepID=A0A1M5VQM2_9BACT|nr:type II secretion system secretin GspD [Desulfofustis glycolicus]MCB2216788.1 type II secretion system secretin GspD [Desulfobulbaceae bacterium]SHH77549.1 general secretion pathway protein D [Desulfofustis glycolicus DSM 9705]
MIVEKSAHVMLPLRLCLIIMMICGLLVCAMPGGDDAIAQEPKGERYITIDFDNVDINLFIKYMSELTGRNFIVDPNVRGNVTIISPTRISETDAYQVFESVLEIHGFTTVQAGSVIKIIPSVEARAKAIDTLRPGDSADPEDRVVTQLVPLRFTTPQEMQKILQPLVSKTSVLLAHTPSGMLIITDTMSNIRRLLEIIAELDVEYTRDEIVVLPLEYANADNLATILNTIFQKSTGGGKEEAVVVTSAVKVVPYERINLLIVLAEPADAARVRRLVEQLDTEVRRGEGNIHVVYLQNARAAELAKVLSGLPQDQEQQSEEGKAPAISEKVTITPDEETNSLIITASRAEFNVLEEVIAKLDIPRRMVYLEALIMEVDADRSLDVGVQWLAGGIFSDETGKLVTGFSGEPAYANIAGITDPDNPSLPTGFTLGVLKEGIKIGDITFPNIAAVLRAYQGDSDINIISTPQILTTDNKKAEILVGQNVPYITSQNTTSSQQDYTQYEYRDVATKLGITPQISQGDTLRLEIATEVTRLKQGSSDDQFRPTTFKRTADTTVIVRDRETIVIGGIIGQDTTTSDFKIPLLGDIPLLGWLFKTHSTTDTKVNMFIFITPHIVKNPADIAGVTLEREDRLSVDMPRAKEELHRVSNTPGQALVLADRGYDALRAGDLVTARDYLAKALQIDPTNPYALINLGVVYQKEGDYRKAIELFRRLIETGTEATAQPPDGYQGDDENLSLLRIARQNIEHLEKLIE